MAHEIGTRELQLAVETKSTNLRIWLSKGIVYMRLDCFKQYSVPLSEKSFSYLDKPHKAVKELCDKYGFNGATEKDIPTILEIVKDMKQRDVREW